MFHTPQNITQIKQSEKEVSILIGQHGCTYISCPSGKRPTKTVNRVHKDPKQGEDLSSQVCNWLIFVSLEGESWDTSLSCLPVSILVLLQASV